MLSTAKIRRGKGVIQPLPRRLQDLMRQLAKELGAKSFILYGGAAMDLLTNPSHEIHDLDIAIVSGREDIERYRKNLEKYGYEILERNREYYLNVIDPVTIVFAKSEKWTLDVAFLKGPLERKINLIPPSPYHTSMDKFDIDSVFWRYPQLDIVDLYDAFNALKNRTMRPIYSLYEENPYLLINRLINICSKYQMDICDNPVHNESFKILAERIARWKHPGMFHGTLVKVAHYSTVLKAITRAQNRGRFVTDLARSRVLQYTMPELQQILDDITDSINKKNLLNAAKTKQDVASVLMNIASHAQKIALEKRLKSLILRTWDLDDRRIIDN